MPRAGSTTFARSCSTDGATSSSSSSTAARSNRRTSSTTRSRTRSPATRRSRSPAAGHTVRHRIHVERDLFQIHLPAELRRQLLRSASGEVIVGRRATAFAARWLLLIVLALPAIWSTGLAAQGAPPAPPNSAKPPPKPTPCELVQQPTTRLTTDSIPGTGRVVFIGGGVLLKCPSRGITLRGDSAQQYPDRDQMIGNAVYDEPRFHVTSDYFNYFPVDDRVDGCRQRPRALAQRLDARWAASRVSARGAAHSTARSGASGRAADRSRSSKRTRPGSPSPPMTVIANNVFMDGDSLIYGSGHVIITRPEFVGDGRLRVHRSGRRDNAPHAKAGAQREEGQPVHADRDRHRYVLQEPQAAARARPAERDRRQRFDDAQIRHDRPPRTRRSIRSRLRVGGAESARVEGRAQVISPSQNLTADSLDVAMPNQRIQLVRAVRRALAQSRPDTVRFRAVKPDTLDWLAGDTIVAHFDSVAAGDTSKNAGDQTARCVRPRELVLSHGAERQRRAPAGNQSTSSRA